MKRLVLLLALCIAALVVLSGCKGSGGSATSADQPVSTPGPVQAKTASVTFAAKFPSKDLTGKSLINTATTQIIMNWYEFNSPNTGSVTLTPQNPTATVMLAPIKYIFEAISTSGTGTTNILDKAATAGKLNVGGNTVNITFLSGKWTFTDGAGTTTTPIELSTGSGSLIVDGFFLSGIDGSVNSGATGTTALNGTLPYVDAYYLATWATGSWSDTTRQAYADHYTQFTGGTTNIDVFDGGFFNLTKGCPDWSDTCHADVNDRVIGIIGASPDHNNGAEQMLPAQTFSPDITTYATSKIVDGTTITGYMLEYVLTAETATIVYTTATGSAIPAKAVFTGGKKSALLAATAGAVKSAQSTNTHINPFNNTEYRAVVVCKDGFNGGTVDGVISLGTWTFQESNCPPGGGQCIPDPSPAAFCGKGAQIQTSPDVVYEYYTCGNVQQNCSSGPCVFDNGECNWGLVAADTGNLGEYCSCGFDQNTGSCNNGCTGQIVSPWNFGDLNGDGVIDFGSFAFAHYMQRDSVMDIYVYPFTAKGTPPQGTQIIVSGAK
jgi:hypothetical protein